MKRILIVEDELDIAYLEQDYLKISDVEADIVSDGPAAIKKALEEDYDLVLLDLMLPGCNGYDVCRAIREEKEIPIIMVTARDDSADKIRGLGMGADDYISKPFDPAELVARVKAHLSRYERILAAAGDRRQEADRRLEFGSLTIEMKSHKVYIEGQEVRLPNKEYELLAFLASNPNIVFTKDQLMERIWGYESFGDVATVTVHINRIREKLSISQGEPGYIETVWGAGYRFNG